MPSQRLTSFGKPVRARTTFAALLLLALLPQVMALGRWDLDAIDSVVPFSGAVSAARIASETPAAPITGECQASAVSCAAAATTAAGAVALLALFVALPGPRTGRRSSLIAGQRMPASRALLPSAPPPRVSSFAF
jgi:hypothetical protein